MARTNINGSNTRTAIIPETTYGTNPGTGAAEIFLTDYDPNYDPGNSAITTLKDTSQSFVKKGNEASSIAFGGKLFKSSIALHAILNRLFKKGTTTGTDPYTHPYTLDYNTIPGSFTFEKVLMGGASSDKATQYLGCVPSAFSLSAQRGEHPTFEFECIARERTRATGPGTAYNATTDKNIFCVGDMTGDALPSGGGTGLQLIVAPSTGYYVQPVNFDFRLETGIDAEAYALTSNLRNQVQRGGPFVASGNLEFVLEDGETWTAKQVADLIADNTEFSFKWRYSTGTSGQSGYRLFDLKLGASGLGVVFDPEGASFNPDGPGRILVNAPFQMYDIESNLSLDIQNEQDGTAVGV